MPAVLTVRRALVSGAPGVDGAQRWGAAGGPAALASVSLEQRRLWAADQQQTRLTPDCACCVLEISSIVFLSHSICVMS